MLQDLPLHLISQVYDWELFLFNSERLKANVLMINDISIKLNRLHLHKFTGQVSETHYP